MLGQAPRIDLLHPVDPICINSAFSGQPALEVDAAMGVPRVAVTTGAIATVHPSVLRRYFSGATGRVHVGDAVSAVRRRAARLGGTARGYLCAADDGFLPNPLAEIERRESQLNNAISSAAEVLMKQLGWCDLRNKPKVATVLGSGLGLFVDSLQEGRRVVPYDKVPHMPISSVPGHAGNWVQGTFGKTPILVAQGRVHCYEGFDPVLHVTYAIRLMHALGIEHVILTNAAGSVNATYEAGDFMLICDHVAPDSLSPMRGLTRKSGGESKPYFVPLEGVYETRTHARIQDLARESFPDIRVHQGVYAMRMGPHFETPAEIRLMQGLGVIDAVGMSTVPEAITARSLGMRVSGVSLITNLGAGISPTSISHEGVQDVAKSRKKEFAQILGWFINEE